MMIQLLSLTNLTTLDDVVGLLPFFALALLFLYGVGQGFAFCLSSLLIIKKRGAAVTTKKQQQDDDDDGDEDDEDDDQDEEEQRKRIARQDLHRQTIMFLLVLSYLLSPLNTMIHLRGKRWNMELYRNGTTGGRSGLFDLVHGTDPKLQAIMARMPSLLRGPKPPLLFANRHLQFVPWLIQNELHRREGIPYQRINMEVMACLDNSSHEGNDDCERSPQMRDIITLDVFPPFGSNQLLENDAPIIMISPGLSSHSQDLPGTMIVRRAFGAGFRSVVVHRRGHTPNLPLKAPRWNIFGDVDDLEQVYWHIRNNYSTAPHTPFFLHGISSGTALVVSALSQWDERRLQGDTTVPTFVGSVSITPGYDISKALLAERFKAPYNPLLTESVKQHFIRTNERILRQYNNDAVDAALAATHFQDLMEAVVPFAGYPNLTSYYEGMNPVNDMHHITTPKLILNSIDDPCCNVHNVYDQSPYPQHNSKTYAQIIADSPRGLLAVTSSGSHCPFLDTAVNGNLFLPSLLPALVPDPLYANNDDNNNGGGDGGGWMLDSWADRISIEFYQAALAVYGSEERM